jgi:hypothetical protein
MRRLVLACLASTLAVAPLAVRAEFLSPTFETLVIDGVAAPEWIAGPHDGGFIGMCNDCPGGLMLLEVKVLIDDGTGVRVKSGETTAETFNQIGKANVAKLGGESAYYSTERIDLGEAVGFKTSARAATGDFSATYQLWSDGKQLLVRVYGKDQELVDTIAEKTYKAAAPLTFR